MFSGHDYVRKDKGTAGKFGLRAKPPSRRPTLHKHKKHPYEITSRQIGLTVKRTVYSVTIHGEQGERLNYISDIPSAAAAEKAAETWIDQALLRRPKYTRSPLYKHLAPEVQAVEEVRSKLDAELQAAQRASE